LLEDLLILDRKEKKSLFWKDQLTASLKPVLNSTGQRGSMEDNQIEVLNNISSLIV